MKDGEVCVNGIIYTEYERSWIFDEDHPEDGPFFVVLYLPPEPNPEEYRERDEIHQKREQYFGRGGTVNVEIASKGKRFKGKGVTFMITEYKDNTQVCIYIWMHEVKEQA